MENARLKQPLSHKQVIQVGSSSLPLTPKRQAAILPCFNKLFTQPVAYFDPARRASVLTNNLYFASNSRLSGRIGNSTFRLFSVTTARIWGSLPRRISKGEVNE